MDKLTKLCQDVVLLWDKYHVLYLNGVKNTLVLALVATAIGCVIGLVCGVLNTIPYTKNDPLPKRFLLKLLRIVIRVYVEVFRGTPMVLQAVFVYYGLPYFTDGGLRLTTSGRRQSSSSRSTPARIWPSPSAAASSPSTPARPRARRPSA